MFKKFLIIILLIISCGCSKKNSIQTIIENDSNIVIGINYPITNTSLDKIVSKDINRIYSKFKLENKNYIFLNNKSELNIDYTFNEIDNYISLGLFIYMDNNKQNDQYTLTYFYDKKKNKILKLDDIIDIDLINDITNHDFLDKFTIDNDNLTIYGKKTYDIPLIDLDFKIKLNTNKKTIKVSYKKKNKVIDPNDKFIMLTFDDGPSIYTDELIEYLNKENCNATFFILGNKVKMYADTLKKSISYGNEIGNHSYNHKWLAKLTLNEYNEQIDKTQNLIKEHIGITPSIIRPTYGSLNEMIKKNTSLDIVLWNVDTLDWKYKNVDKIVKRATKNLKEGNIILMHDTHKRTIDAVKKIVPIIKEKGFKCITVSDYKTVSKLREQNG